MCFDDREALRFEQQKEKADLPSLFEQREDCESICKLVQCEEITVVRWCGSCPLILHGNDSLQHLRQFTVGCKEFRLTDA